MSSNTKKASCYLVIDTREHAVYKENAETLSEIPYEIRELAAGDYMICAPNHQVLTIFERKTYEDYAATILDPERYRNKEKLISAVEQTNCRVGFIVEGARPKNGKIKVGGIPFSAIRSSMFHIFQRDNFGIFETRSRGDTATFLIDFVKSMNSLYLKPGAQTPNPKKAGGVEALGTLQMRRLPGPMYNGGIDHTAQKDAVLAIEKTVTWNDIVKGVWMEAVSGGIAESCMAKFSLRDFVENKIDWNKFVYSSGRKLTKKQIQNLNIIKNSSLKYDEIVTKMLGKVPKLSIKSAKFILTSHKLVDLLDFPVDELAKIPKGEVKANGRQALIGEKTAELILAIFNFRVQPEDDS